MLYVQFLFLLLILYLGSRYGGIGLGVVSGIGLVVEVFVFQMPPTSPPITVMLIIMAVVTCASILEAAGGLKYMLQIAEKLLRSNPRMISLLGPLVTYAMTFMLGTGHAVYSVMPIIADVALKNDIRPERPMAAASVASQLGITASPISAAVDYYLSQLTNVNVELTLLSILGVTIPATLTGVIAMSLYSMRRGVELADDPEYQRRMKDPIWRKRIEETTSTTLDETLPASSRHAVFLFALALITIVIIAMFPEIRTIGDSAKAIKMSVIIQMMMLPVAMGMGLSPALVIGIMPSCYGYFFIPNYPSDIATCTFDVTGTTKIGKYYFNHSFMAPGLIGVITACGVGYPLAQILI